MFLIDGQTGIFQKVIQGDHWLFSRINQEWTSPFFDNIALFLREAELWMPFYLFLLIYVTLNFRKKGWWWVLYFTFTAVIGDLLSSHLVKQAVYRVRPCQDPLLADSVRVLASYCPVSSSFTSSHACNHFALANFIFLTLGPVSRWWALVYAWAFLIAYSQVYVGVHFPLDVTGGALLGLLIGYGTSKLYRFQFGDITLQALKYSND